MSNICRVCGRQKRYDEYHRLYEPCDSCNTKRAIKYYYNNKDKIIEKREISIIKIKYILINIVKNGKADYQILKIKLNNYQR